MSVTIYLFFVCVDPPWSFCFVIRSLACLLPPTQTGFPPQKWPTTDGLNAAVHGILQAVGRIRKRLGVFFFLGGGCAITGDHS